MAIVDVKTEITGNVWKIVKTVGDEVEEDEPILILESMKMEIPVASPEDGVIIEILTNEGDTVTVPLAREIPKAWSPPRLPTTPRSRVLWRRCCR
jgi:acetyl-CoA carboxylase biotin carboxyl carrier protein